MAEGVDGLLGSADIVAGRIADAFRYGDNDVVALEEQAFDVQKKILGIKRNLRQINKVRRGVIMSASVRKISW